MLAIFRFDDREGPGIPKDTPCPTGLRLVADVVGREWGGLVKLNLLFLAAALPLVTLPAALAGLFRVTLSMVEDRPHDVLRDFLDAMRARLLSATLVGIALGAVAALAAVALSFHAHAAAENPLFALPLAVSAIVLAAVPLYGAALFVLSAMSDRPMRRLLRPAAIALLLAPGRSLAALGVVAALWLVHVALYPASLLMPVLINFSFGALAMTFGARDAAVLALSHDGTGEERARAFQARSMTGPVWRRTS